MFPPPKTHFGLSPLKRSTVGGTSLWEAPVLGGLTNFWGASAVPFTERELGGWPISREELAEYYQHVADIIGIAGESDNLTHYFGRDFVTRPAVPPIPLARRLSDQMVPSAGNYSFFAGLNRLAVETRLDHNNRCIRCGNCMTGCGTGSIYSARTDIQRQIANARVHKVAEAVQSLDLRRRSLRLDSESDWHSFDRIFLAAGCIGSTELIIRSLGIKEGPVMVDNVTYTFPIFYLGKAIMDAEPKRYFGLTNTAVICAPHSAEEHSCFIQIYPLFDHLWRYFVPVGFWPVLAPLAARLRGRMLIARLYLHSSHGASYGFSMVNDSHVEISCIREPRPLADASGLWAAIRSAVCRNGFFIPPMPPIRHAANSHYAASFPLGGALVDRDGRLGDGIYLCDAANFFDGPALSPTLTIMANAARIAYRSL